MCSSRGAVVTVLITLPLLGICFAQSEEVRVCVLDRPPISKCDINKSLNVEDKLESSYAVHLFKNAYEDTFNNSKPFNLTCFRGSAKQALSNLTMDGQCDAVIG